MAGVNKVILIGNLGKDPRISTTGSGAKVATFSLATSETWKDKNTGERRERTEWHNVVIYNEGLVGVASSYLKKGSKVFVEGQLRTRKWTDQGGVERYITEVVLAAFRGELALLDKAERPVAEESDYGSTRARGAPGASASPSSHGGSPDPDDDIPF